MGKKQKYFFVFISLFVYTVSVCGVTINKHFCGGELESVSLIKQESCCDGEMEESDTDESCCSDETIYLSNKSESLNHLIKISVDPFLILLNTVTTQLFFKEQSVIQSHGFTHSRGKPPSQLQSELSYLMVFRI